ncbi:MAG TPA: hypothetical protein PKI93_01175 [Alphaproteobacteria bacterium]|nr:hypothetical protein [Alphaproteobacteria bacterium]
MLLTITFLKEATQTLLPEGVTFERLTDVVKNALGESVANLMGLTGSFNGVLFQRNGDVYSLGLPFSNAAVKEAHTSSPQDFKDYVETFLQRRLFESPNADINAKNPIKVRLG